MMQSPTFLPPMLISALIFLLVGARCISELNAIPSPGHSNFLKAKYGSGGRTPFVGCANDPESCSRSRHGKNSRCCFNKFCRDISTDPLHCGFCGHACPYGLICCGGVCADLNNDDRHCGNCFTLCPLHESCEFGMCGYGSPYTYKRNPAKERRGK